MLTGNDAGKYLSSLRKAIKNGKILTICHQRVNPTKTLLIFHEGYRARCFQVLIHVLAPKNCVRSFMKKLQ